MSPRKQIIYAFLLLGLSKIFTYFLLLILGNRYSVSDYGSFSFVFAIFQIALAFVLMGIPSLFTPWVVKGKDYTSVFFFLFAAAAACSLAFIIVSVKYLFVLPIGLSFVLVYLREAGGCFLRVEHKYAKVQLSLTIAAFVTPFAAALLYKFGALGISWAYFSGFLASVLFVLVMSKGAFSNMLTKAKFSLGACISYLRKARFVLAATVSGMFLGWIDSFVLGFFALVDDVARYNISYSIANVITMIPVSLSFFLLTRGAEIADTGLSEKLFAKVARISYSMSLLLAIVIASLMGLLINYFFPAYIGIGPYASALLAGMTLVSVYYLVSVYFSSRMSPEKMVLPVLSAAILNLVLDVVLVPAAGIRGIILATVASHLLAFWLMMGQIKMRKAFFPVLLFSPLIIIGYAFGEKGLLLVPLAAIGLGAFGLLRMKDLAAIYGTLKNIICKGNGEKEV